MSAKDFLVELGTEELPPKALKSLGDAFLAGIEKVAESDVDEALANGEQPAPIEAAGEREPGGEAAPEQGDEA